MAPKPETETVELPNGAKTTVYWTEQPEEEPEDG